MSFPKLLGSSVNAYDAGMVASSLHFQRHIVVPVAITVVLLFAVVGNTRPKIVKFLGSGCLLAGIGGMLHDFTPAAYQFRPDLTNLAECAESGQVCVRTKNI